MPMPKSWSKKKRAEMDSKDHRQKPDLDNLIKAFLDSVAEGDDAFVSSLSATKLWGEKGRIWYNIVS